MLEVSGGGKISPEEIMEQWDKAQTYWFLEQQRLYFITQYLIKLNVDQEKLKDQFKESFKRYGKGFYNNLMEGVFTPWELPDFYQENFDEATERMIDKQIKDGRDPNLIRRYWPEEVMKDKYDYLKESEISLVGNPTLPLP